jgi:hypothetical protein
MSAHDIAMPDTGLGSKRFRIALRQRAGATAVPYGYTALTASTFGVLIDTHGPPTSRAAALFLTGAILGFTLAALPGTSSDGADAHEAAPAVTGLASGAAAAVAFAIGALLAHAIDSDISFGVVALAATAVYLGIGALAAALIEHRGQDGPRSD